MTDIMKLSQKFEAALLSLDRVAAGKILQSQLKSANSPLEHLENIVIPAMDSIGRAWDKGSVSLSQVYMSGRICEDLIGSILPPHSAERKERPSLAIAVLDDYHLLGKRIVSSVLLAGGFILIDYGHGVSPESLLSSVQKDNIDILLISVLMLPSALHVKQLRHLIDKSGMKTKIIVGGAPFRFDTGLWKEVGADAMGKNASEAIELVNKFTKGTRGGNR